jgi:hypothetical protein
LRRRALPRTTRAATAVTPHAARSKALGSGANSAIDTESSVRFRRGPPPVVGAEFPLADALLAYRHKPARGKVVLRLGDVG